MVEKKVFILYIFNDKKGYYLVERVEIGKGYN